MAKPDEYLHIWAWGKMMLSYDGYIKRQQEQAAADNAPIDAIYERDGQWRTFSQVENRRSIGKVQSLLATRRGLES